MFWMISTAFLVVSETIISKPATSVSLAALIHEKTTANQHFHDRDPDPEWFDESFGILIDWVICQRGQSREQAMAPIAITNFYEKVLQHIGQATSGFVPSETAFRQRLARLQPKVVLLPCEDQYVLAAVRQATSEANIHLVESIHPTKRYIATKERVKRMRADWEKVRQHLESSGPIRG
jgi:hypothetical protein